MGHSSCGLDKNLYLVRIRVKATRSKVVSINRTNSFEIFLNKCNKHYANPPPCLKHKNIQIHLVLLRDCNMTLYLSVQKARSDLGICHF